MRSNTANLAWVGSRDADRNDTSTRNVLDIGRSAKKVGNAINNEYKNVGAGRGSKMNNTEHRSVIWDGTTPVDA